MSQISVNKSGSRVYLTGPYQAFAQQGAVGTPVRYDWPSIVPSNATLIHCVAQTVRIPVGSMGNADASLIISLPSDINSAFRSIGIGGPPGGPEHGPFVGAGAFGSNTFVESLGEGRFDIPSDPSDPRAFYWVFKGSITDNGSSGGTWGVNWTLVIDGWDLP